MTEGVAVEVTLDVFVIVGVGVAKGLVLLGVTVAVEVTLDVLVIVGVGVAKGLVLVGVTV